MPLYTVYILSVKTWPLGETLCDLWLSLDYTACLCSIYTVFCITVDRFCSIRLPARYRMWRTERKACHFYIPATHSRPIFVLLWIFVFTTSMKVPWSGNYSAYNEPMTSHKLGGLAGSRLTLLHMQQRAAGGRHGRHLETMTYRKCDSVNWCAFTWRKILPNFIPVRFETTEP